MRALSSTTLLGTLTAVVLVASTSCQTLQTSQEKGAVIGAVVGGGAGAIIGHQMDQKAKEITASVPDKLIATGAKRRS